MIINKPLDSSKKQLFRKLITIALPVSVQSLLSFSVNLLDNMMLGSLGEVQISAASQANQFFFMLSLMISGIVGGSNVLVAQFWGCKKKDSISGILAYTYRIAIAFALLLTVLGAVFPHQVMSIFSADQAVIDEGARYLRILAISYVFYTITSVTTGTLRCVSNVHVSVILSAISLVISASLNWVLIFGNLGAPSLGIVGAAVSTLIARLVEFTLAMLYMKFKEKQLKIRVKELLHWDKRLAKKYYSNTVPVILNEFFWAVGSWVLAAIMGRIGTSFVAANSIFNTTSQIAGVLGTGLSAAGAVMIGNAIGSGETEHPLLIKRQLQIVGLAAGIFSAVLILVMRPFMLMIYNVSDITLICTNQMMWVGAAIQVFKTMQTMNMMGILRGGGDAAFVMVNDIIFLWVLAVPLGFLAGLVWDLPVPIVFFILNIEQPIKFFTSAFRLRRNKWITNVTAY